MFDYNSTIIAAANQWGIDPSVGFGLFQQESGNNPNMGYAKCPPGVTCSAYGPGQLTIAAANQVGVDRFDPVQNIFGSMHYLSEQISRYGGDVTKGLAAYNQGHVNAAGLDYASSVWNKAKSFMNGVFTKQNIGDAVSMGLNAAIPGSGEIVNALGFGTGSGEIVNALGFGSGESWLQQFQDWIKNSGFFERLALAFVGLIFILGVVYTLKGK